MPALIPLKSRADKDFESSQIDVIYSAGEDDAGSMDHLLQVWFLNPLPLIRTLFVIQVSE